MKIVIIEPYYTGSHGAWIDGIVEHSNHDVSVLKLPGRYWKWRMHGGSITLAREFLKLEYKPDLIIATDMLDLSGFLSLTRKETHSIPVAMYFHENQINYPWSSDDKDILNNRDKHYGFINYISALAADFILFNSKFHMNSFIQALPDFLKHFPDYNELSTISSISEKSRALPLGVELSKFDKYKPDNIFKNLESSGIDGKRLPVILWNHRWEYDKNPKAFFDALYELDSKGIEFQIVILGESFKKIPAEFEEAKKRLSSKIIKFGYADSFDEYAKWLWHADIILVTSNQEFFGISIIEALYCQCVPVLPNRLTYPELVPLKDFSAFFYNDNNPVSVLEKKLASIESLKKSSFREVAVKYDWRNMIKEYDGLFVEIVK